MSRVPFLLGLLALFAGCKGEDTLVNYNIAPSAALFDPEDGTIVEAGQAVVFRGKVADDGPIEDLEIQWSSSADGIVESTVPPDADGNLTMETSNLTPGEHLVTLRAFDPEGEQGQASVTVIVEEIPEAPWITVVHPSGKDQGQQDTLYTFEVEVGDRQDPAPSLVVEMTSTIDTNADGTPDVGCFMVPGGDGHGSCTPTTPIPVGSHLLSFTVTDTEGNTATANASFDVLAREDLDLDGDGWTPRLGDCDDLNKLVYPNAPENCDSLDNDCNPSTPIDGPQTECWDDDGDGFCETGACVNASGTTPDCDDANRNAYPNGNGEQPNHTDDDCDGTVDEGTVNYDDDGDGYCESGDCENTTETARDCADADPNAYPSAKETCDPGNVDNDCDGEWNEKDAPGCTKYYKDEDGDAYGGKSSTSECWCAPGRAPFTGTNNTDCLDTDSNTHPGQTQFFANKRGDGKNFDYNCDGADEKQYRGTTTGCFENWSGFECEVTSAGWQGGEKACGVSGNYLNDCDTTFDPICALFCSGADCADCISCAAAPENRTQMCR